MAADFADLFGREVWIDDVNGFFDAAEFHEPDVGRMRDFGSGSGDGSGAFVFEDAFAHQDEGEDEAEADFFGEGGFGTGAEALEEVDEDGVVDEEFLFLLGDGDDGAPVAEHGEGGFGAFAGDPAGFAEVDAEEGAGGFGGLFIGFLGLFWGGGDGVGLERALAEGGPAGGVGGQKGVAGSTLAGGTADLPGRVSIEHGHRGNIVVDSRTMQN